MDDKARPDQAAEAEHQGEQPDDARRRRLIGEDDVELGEVDLGLFTGRGLEPELESPFRGRADIAEEIGDGGVAAAITDLLQLPEKPTTSESRDSSSPARADRP